MNAGSVSGMVASFSLQPDQLETPGWRINIYQIGILLYPR